MAFISRVLASSLIPTRPSKSLHDMPILQPLQSAGHRGSRLRLYEEVESGLKVYTSDDSMIIAYGILFRRKNRVLAEASAQGQSPLKGREQLL